MRKTSSNLKRVGKYWQASLGYAPQLSSLLIVQCNVPISFSSLDLHVALLISMPVGGANVGPMIGYHAFILCFFRHIKN